MHDAVHVAVHGAVDGAVHGAVHGAVRGAVHDVVRKITSRQLRTAISQRWNSYLGGQFWVGGPWYWGPAFTSFFREVCKLDLPGDLWDRGRAYEATCESACWWWPHRQFIMVCERPTVIHRELRNPRQLRGWGSHQLHCDTGPAAAWPDGWGVYAWHGTQVPAKVIEAPDSLTPTEITNEPNAEIRRVMLERYGAARYAQDLGHAPVAVRGDEELYRIPRAEDSDLCLVRVVNSTPEPLNFEPHGDHVVRGNRWFKRYWLRVRPTVKNDVGAAIASTFDVEPANYVLDHET